MYFSFPASCALIHPWEAVVIGALGALLCCATPLLLTKLKVDDPVGAVAVHGTGGLWVSLLSQTIMAVLK